MSDLISPPQKATPEIESLLHWINSDRVSQFNRDLIIASPWIVLNKYDNIEQFFKDEKERIQNETLDKRLLEFNSQETIYNPHNEPQQAAMENEILMEAVPRVETGVEEVVVEEVASTSQVQNDKEYDYNVIDMGWEFQIEKILAKRKNKHGEVRLLKNTRAHAFLKSLFLHLIIMVLG